MSKTPNSENSYFSSIVKGKEGGIAPAPSSKKEYRSEREERIPLYEEMTIYR